jgi:hypothetical protein
MAKKYKAKEQAQTVAVPAPAVKPSFRFNGHNLLPLVTCMLYFLIHFIANFDAYDAMGPQWMYMVGLDLVVTKIISQSFTSFSLRCRVFLLLLPSILPKAGFVMRGLSLPWLLISISASSYMAVQIFLRFWHNCLH